ncbi:MAG: 3-phosphoshikimate 1-carboxyvinyltransferase [Coriobacteriia bacterium]|nr:3-phosphoshikimate 1-carboxyvinyltransferase [Coriobacteriia bacterium]
MWQDIRPAAGPLRGTVRVPGDKSISHRAVLFSAMAEGPSRLSGVLDSADVGSTIAAVEALGARVHLQFAEGGSLEGVVAGWGSVGPSRPVAPIDCGNSGTTARLLMGVLAGWDVQVILTGDESLSTRPMSRVTDPLAEMGADFVTDDGHLPVMVTGASLRPLTYANPVGSAQVKTAILLAGMRASGRTSVSEPARSRDHTERLLPVFGVEVGVAEEKHEAWVDGPVVPTAAEVNVPGDLSSAAFHIVAAAILPSSDIRIEGVSLNPTRLGFLRVLERMGANVEIEAEAPDAGEPSGNIVAKYSSGLVGTLVEAEEIPSLIDEIPILAVAAASATGYTRFEGAGELRVKESDRLAAIERALTTLGVDVSVEEDALEIQGKGSASGPIFESGNLDSLGDHRLAMAWAVAGLASESGVSVDRFEAVDVSYPDFFGDLSRMTGLL